MKRIFCCIIPSVLIASAQTTPDQETAARMAAHLLPAVTALTLPDPVHDEVYSPQEIRSLSTPSLQKVMKAYQEDIFQVEWTNSHVVQRPDETTPTLRSFISGDQAYKLAHSLAGKQVTEDSLKSLCAAIIRLVRASVQCRNVDCKFRNDRSGREAAEAVQTGLQSIGLRDTELQYVMNSVLRGAITASSAPLRTFYR